MDTSPDEAFPPQKTSPGTMAATGEELTEDDIELEELQALDPESSKRRALQLVRKYRRRKKHDEERLAQAQLVVETARRNDEARKKQPASVPAQTAPSTSDAGAGAGAAGAAPTMAAGPEKFPQAEANKREADAKDAS